MMADEAKWIVGVDAGGSKTVAWLASFQEESAHRFSIKLVGCGVSGPANPGAVGVGSALASINAAIRLAIRNRVRAEDFSDQGPRVVVPASIWVAAAGAARSEISQQLRQGIAGEYPGSIVEASGDVSAMIAAARAVGRSSDPPDWILRNATSSSSDGFEFQVNNQRPGFVAETVIECKLERRQAVLAIIAGTGSVVWAADGRGNEKQWGGQGTRFGDVGSGCWLGQQAIRAVQDCERGNAPATGLAARVLQHFEIADLRDLERIMPEIVEDSREMARLAPLVLCAAACDPMAAEIVECGLQGLAELARQAAGWLADETSITWALGGGVLAQNPEIAKRLVVLLAGAKAFRQPVPVDILAESKGPSPVTRLSDSMKVVYQPVWGAVLLAANEFVARRTKSFFTLPAD